MAGDPELELHLAVDDGDAEELEILTRQFARPGPSPVNRRASPAASIS